MKKLMAMLLAGIMVLGLAACGGNAGNNQAPDTYTMNTYMEASPLNWNPHAWEMNNEDTLMSYINMGFVDISIAEDGVNYTWVYEMATKIEDVTTTWDKAAEWGVTYDYGQVYKIELNPDACWDDGTPITAADYIYSMQQMLNPEMKNYRANSYYTGSVLAVMGGYGYYNNDKAGQPIYGADNSDGENQTFTNDTWVKGDDGVYTAADGTKLVFDVKGALNYLGGYSVTDYADAYGIFQEIVAMADGDGFVAITDESIAAMMATLSTETWGFEDESCLGYYVKYENGTFEETPWEKVGLIADGDYTLYYVLETPSTEFYFLANMTSTWLVKQDLYEAGKSTVEGLVATDYCTSQATTACTGPYKLVSFEADKQMRLTRNENWYGWKDGKHEGQFQTTDIVFDIVAEHSTQMQLFQQGKLDGVTLNSDDMDTYRMSDYLLKTDATYTFRFIFATDIEALKALEDKANDGANKRVLAYDDFRKAISLAMDRADYAAQATSAYKPAYFLLNYLYYYDIENNAESQYRNTVEGMEAVLNLYGIEYGEGKTYATVEEAYAAVTGYDVEAARALFQAVYEQAIADGNYTDGQPIHIQCMCSAASSMSADDTRQQDLLNDMVAEATKGTGFEGKITFEFLCGSTTRYDDVASGKIEMIRGAWGGAAFYPFSTIRVYCEPDYMGGLSLIHESCGWDPTVETITITYDFDADGVAETVTDTFQNWAKSINGGGAYDGNAEASLKILSALETGILGAYQCIPWATETACDLYSQKIKYATLNYNIMYGYGGIRLMTYNYTDAAWADYVSSQGGTLNYE